MSGKVVLPVLPDAVAVLQPDLFEFRLRTTLYFSRAVLLGALKAQQQLYFAQILPNLLLAFQQTG